MKKHLTCSCCAGYAGHFEQHFNQDKGYGLCPDCVHFIRNHQPFGREDLRISEAAFRDAYGLPGVNYAED